MHDCHHRTNYFPKLETSGSIEYIQYIIIRIILRHQENDEHPVLQIFHATSVENTQCLDMGEDKWWNPQNFVSYPSLIYAGVTIWLEAPV